MGHVTLLSSRDFPDDRRFTTFVNLQIGIVLFHKRESNRNGSLNRFSPPGNHLRRRWCAFFSEQDLTAPPGKACFEVVNPTRILLVWENALWYTGTSAGELNMAATPSATSDRWNLHAVSLL
jgi:hypothetical protein